MTKNDKGPEGEKVEHLHFSLGEDFGQLITDLAREKAWNDCKEGDGIIMLIEGLDCSPDQARAVINGKKRFVTNDDHVTLGFVDDDWTPPDFKGMQKEVDSVLEDAEKLLETVESTCYSYLMSERDRCIIRGDIADVRELAELNLWKAGSRLACLKDWASDIRGRMNEDTIGDKARKVTGEFNEDDDFDLDPLKALAEDTKARIDSMPMDPEMKERMKRLADSQLISGDHEKVVEDLKFKSDTGWLDRDGRYWGCELGRHIPYAEKLMVMFFPDTEGDGEKILNKFGWMKCTGKQWWTGELAPDAAQQKTFKKWVRKWGKRYKYNGVYYNSKKLPLFGREDD